MLPSPFSILKQNPFFIQQDTHQIYPKLPFITHGYRFHTFIGNGSCGSVVQATHLSSNQEFAAKIFKSDVIVSNNEINVIKSEIESLKQLYHPNIIKLYSYFREYGQLFLILQLCEGGTLQTIIEKHVGIKSNVLIPLMKQILNALAFCHHNLIAHRDIKPANIFLDTTNKPMLGDFGLSISIDQAKQVNTFCGSFKFQSPESLEKQPHDPYKADIWSLGVTFYYMATGNDPWPQFPHEEIYNAITKGIYRMPKRVNSEIGSMIKSMMNTDPNQRPNVDELLELPLFLSERMPDKMACSLLSNQSRPPSQMGAHRNIPLCYHSTMPHQKRNILELFSGTRIVKHPLSRANCSLPSLRVVKNHKQNESTDDDIIM